MSLRPVQALVLLVTGTDLLLQSLQLDLTGLDADPATAPHSYISYPVGLFKLEIPP